MPGEPVPYRPSNGTDGDCFQAMWCAHCKHDTARHPCKILVRAMALGVDEPGYPAEWVETEDGPTCTAFEPPGAAKPRRRHKPAKGQGELFPRR